MMFSKCARHCTTNLCVYKAFRFAILLTSICVHDVCECVCQYVCVSVCVFLLLTPTPLLCTPSEYTHLWLQFLICSLANANYKFITHTRTHHSRAHSPHPHPHSHSQTQRVSPRLNALLRALHRRRSPSAAEAATPARTSAAAAAAGRSSSSSRCSGNRRRWRQWHWRLCCKGRAAGSMAVVAL